MNANTQQRLLQFSETPPASVWNGIADALDRPAFAQKLHEFEAAPPTHSWQAIEQQVTATGEGVARRIQLFQKAIAAAAVLLLVAGGIFYLTTQRTTNVARQPQPNVTQPVVTNTFSTAKPTQPHATPASHDTPAKSHTDARGNAVFAARAFVHFSPRVRIPKKTLPASTITVAPEEKTSVDTSLQSRYMIATTASGNVVRLPKKAYSDYACADRFQNYRCKEKIAAVQSKLAASVATDFTDFIDLLKKLQDNP